MKIKMQGGSSKIKSFYFRFILVFYRCSKLRSQDRRLKYQEKKIQPLLVGSSIAFWLLTHELKVGSIVS